MHAPILAPGGGKGISLTTIPRSPDQDLARLQPAPAASRTGTIALAVVASAWAIVAAMILRHRVLLTTDAVSNHVHVWYIADRIWHHGSLTFKIPVLAGGDALTFPYASIPWLTAALAWPLFGDWTITLWLVAGFVGAVFATFWAFPELRTGWWAAAALLNPALVLAPMLGQLPFLWAITCFFVAIGSWRRGRTGWALAACAVAQIIHPAVLIPIAAALVLLWLPFERDKRGLLFRYGLSLLPVLPFAWMVMVSPVMESTTLWEQFVAELGTVGFRILVVVVPIALILLQRQKRPIIPVALALTFLAVQVPMYRPFNMNVAWASLVKKPDPTIATFVQSADFVPGATYRVLTGFDGKYGPYSLVRGGARLDSEFFPESLHRASFVNDTIYARFLNHRRVDFVVVAPTYKQAYRSNEPERLASLAASGACTSGVDVAVVDTTADYIVYRVQRGC